MPYAQDTGGKGRFRVPQTLTESWEGIREAKQYGHACPDENMEVDGAYGMSENCLSLNIVRPAGINATSRLPVMLWIHGGSYQVGTSALPYYNLTYLVQKSVEIGKPVLGVSINYRKGAWGMLYSVEIQGQLLLSYGGRSDGLFHRSIQESGSATTAWYNGSDWYQPFYNKIVDQVNCTNEPDTLACLRTIDYDVLYPVMGSSNFDGPGFYPTIDGDIIPNYPSELMDTGRFSTVPHLYGTVSDEGTDNAPKGLINTDEDLRDYLRHGTGFDFPDPTISHIMELYPDDPTQGIPLNTGSERFADNGWQYKRISAILGDVFYHAPRRYDARRYATLGPTYVYRFNTRGFVNSTNTTYTDLTGELGPASEGVSHFTDVPFVFANPYYVGPWPEYRALSHQMSSQWIHFAYYGDPNTPLFVYDHCPVTEAISVRKTKDEIMSPSTALPEPVKAPAQGTPDAAGGVTDSDSGNVQEINDRDRADIEKQKSAQGNAHFHRLGWKRLTVVLLVEAIALGTLSIPSAFATLGMVAGVILSVGLGLIAVYTSYIVGQVKLRFPHVSHYADAGRLLMGNFGYELVGTMFALELIFTVGSHCLTGAIALNNITDHGTCSVVFGLVSAIILVFLAIPPSFAEVAILGYIDFASIFIAVGITIIATGIQYTHPTTSAAIDATPWQLWPKEGLQLAEAFVALGNIIFAYSFALCQFSFMDEMHTPEDFPKSIVTLGVIEIVIYTLTGALIYVFVGQDVQSPALLSAGTTVSKVAFGIALPVIFISGSINTTVVARYIHGRVFKHSIIRYINTKAGWITWLILITVITIIAWVIAEAIPFFSDLLSIASCLFVSGFTFYFPAAFWFKLLKDGHWYEMKNIVKSIVNAIIFIIGMVILGVGTYASVQDIKTVRQEAADHGVDGDTDSTVNEEYSHNPGSPA
ncbi:hypothetical protein JX265_002705 [Neoarthrinium moseri]|uniref:Amino acid transporter transmembrane domain-containing protein n=1 Tax=Neoarthrinium moseri TaxID=1658444 RepID=A0A9P9WV05_9PEZI|nr:hypothetical protein JX266_011151 [Neoarthrinium moseri]KAI1879751.1 hypothetical protein JX265_002705 [Neoarthrinium moseri]